MGNRTTLEHVKSSQQARLLTVYTQESKVLKNSAVH